MSTWVSVLLLFGFYSMTETSNTRYPKAQVMKTPWNQVDVLRLPVDLLIVETKKKKSILEAS